MPKVKIVKKTRKLKHKNNRKHNRKHKFKTIRAGAMAVVGTHPKRSRRRSLKKVLQTVAEEDVTRPIKEETDIDTHPSYGTQLPWGLPPPPGKTPDDYKIKDIKKKNDLLNSDPMFKMIFREVAKLPYVDIHMISYEDRLKLYDKHTISHSEEDLPSETDFYKYKNQNEKLSHLELAYREWESKQKYPVSERRRSHNRSWVGKSSYLPDTSPKGKKRSPPKNIKLKQDG